MKKVNVLISTYNGERYIREQIDSVLSQTYSNIKIWVRDDGSTDNTLNILVNYESQGQIALIRGENVGFGASFLYLLNEADEGTYWAFCDQDDVWDCEKIERAVEQLEQMDVNRANVYFHNFILTDENLQELAIYHNRIPDYSFQMALTECLHMGFATVMNREMRRLMLKGDITTLPSHDWWMELIAMAFGNIYTDDYIGANHRRLDSSLSNNRLTSRVKWFFGALKGNSEIQEITKQFYNVFGKELSEYDRKVLSLFVSEHYDLEKAIKKCFYIKRWRTSLASEIVVRFLMIIGKI